MVTTENWTHCAYQQKSSGLLARLTIGAEVDPQGQQVDIYYVTVLNGEHKEVSQNPFPNQSDAIDSLNSMFSHWEFVDQETEAKKPNSEGCSSCQAH
ncbi:MAG: hypothetical protein H6621_09040 [Halobacteriovoraceae bacterium]|nr:hypothetical protein [Halobacteriovoraceae bacterium]MCB9095199.1 hypothetical protein [Halobacteriovoraceae bacterium]